MNLLCIKIENNTSTNTFKIDLFKIEVMTENYKNNLLCVTLLKIEKQLVG